MQNIWQYLNRELRATPGRGGYTLRLTLSCAVLITLFMTLQIPFLAVALIVAFYVSQQNVLMIKLIGIVFLITISVAIGGILLIFKWTYDYPLIRLVASTLLFFCAMYLMRVLGKLGLAFFVVALSVIYAQTFPSMTSESEVLVRLLLWLWVAINTAILVTLLVNACFYQAFPGYQFKALLAQMLRQTSAQWARLGDNLKLEGQPKLLDVAAQFSRLQLLHKLAGRSSAEISNDPEKWQLLMAAASRCYHLTALLQQDENDPQVQQQARMLSGVLADLAEHLDADVVPAKMAMPAASDSANVAILLEMTRTLTRLAQGEAIPLRAEGQVKEPLLLPDAWSNPAYLHFALKTLLATLICYVFYTATDWQGIHTIMLSCVIVAQPGLGATMHKTLLRIGGALLATLLALVCIVFIQPHTDSLTGLLAMALPVIALGAWLAAGSERIAYAGIQIAFTFSLAFFSWFGPLYNLTELRDRVIGILLGVLVSSIVHLYLWPDSEAPQLKAQLARLYRQIADYLTAKEGEANIAPLLQTLMKTETLIGRVSAEPFNTYAHPYPQAKSWPINAAFMQAQEIVRLSEGYRLYRAPGDTFLPQCAQLLRSYADNIEQPGAAAILTPVERNRPMNPFLYPLTQAMQTLPDWRQPHLSEIKQ